MFIEDALRQFWAPGIQNIQKNDSLGLKEWLKDGNSYQIISTIKKDEFEISAFDRETILLPISADCNRFATSSLESALKTDTFEPLPRSISWLLIRQYYSAFYAGHLILRMTGLSLTQLESHATSKIQVIADLFGCREGISIEKGYYKVEFNNIDPILTFEKVNVNADGGSHVVLWKMLGEKIQNFSLDILNSSLPTETQAISNKLKSLIDNLKYVGSTNFNWLSRMRNEINYKQSYGVWFPFNHSKSDVDYIKRNTFLWNNDIMQIELDNLTGRELVRFSNSCQFITGLGMILCSDMAERCSLGKSFLSSGFNKIRATIST